MSKSFPIQFSWLVFLFVGFVSFSTEAVSPEESLQKIVGDSDYIDLSTIPGVVVDLRYATKNNFTGENIYGDFKKALLHRQAAKKISKAAEFLTQRKPGWKLLILDALRPRSAQWILWNKVRGTAEQNYVKNPQKGSVHNYGFAVDITLIDGEGKEVDMGTPYDAFTRLAQPRYEDQFLKEGKLTSDQIANRKLLRDVMQSAGFIQLVIEWWHFDALPPSEVRKNYPIVE